MAARRFARCHRERTRRRACSRSTPRRCGSSGRCRRSSTAACGTAFAASRRGATRSPRRDSRRSASRIRDAGLTVTGYCRGGMFPAVDREGRRAALDDNRRAVDEALTLGAQCLILVVGGLPRTATARIESKDLAGAREMVRDGIGELLELRARRGHAARDRAAASDVRRRPRMREHDGARQRPLRRARAPAWASPSTRITCGGIRSSSARSSAPAGDSPSRLLAYHICDWLVPTTDLLTDRGMMGDGVIDLPPAALVDGSARLSRLPRGRDLFRQQLVEARSGRSARHLQARHV